MSPPGPERPNTPEQPRERAGAGAAVLLTLRVRAPLTINPPRDHSKPMNPSKNRGKEP